jgi:Rieske Fe-S protein
MDDRTPVNKGRRAFCRACIGGMTAASAGMVGYPIVSFLAPAERPGSNKPLEIPYGSLGAGQAQYVDFRGQQIILLVMLETTPEGPQLRPRVFSASCPHLGCSVMWESANEVFRCPCHGAVFDATGKVIRGPVSAPLEKIKVEIKDKDKKVIVS